MRKENNQNDRAKLITTKCPECQQLDPVDGITCHAGVVSSGDPEETKKSCVWFWPKHKYNTKLSEPSGRRVDPCNCSHHGEPILGSAHGRCNHPANFATATTCGFWNAKDCFRFTEKDPSKICQELDSDHSCRHRVKNPESVETYLCNHPAVSNRTCDYTDVLDCFLSGKIRVTPDAPAPAPVNSTSDQMPRFVPVHTDAFEALERKAYYRGVVDGLNEAKCRIKPIDVVKLIDEIDELVKAAQKECEK